MHVAGCPARRINSEENGGCRSFDRLNPMHNVSQKGHHLPRAKAARRLVGNGEIDFAVEQNEMLAQVS